MKSCFGYRAAFLLCLSFLLQLPDTAAASRQDPGALWKYSVPYALDLRPDCARQMTDADPGTELGLNKGLFFMHVSDVDREERERSSACSRWQTTARLQAKQFDIEKLDLELRRIYADLTFQWRFVHLGRKQRYVFDPGLNVILRSADAPRFFGWMNLSLGEHWKLRFEGTVEMARAERSVAWNTTLTRFF